jgi:hypothetical protein
MSQENVEIAKRLTDAFNRRKVDALLDLAIPDCVMSSQLLDATADFQGREGLERFYAMLSEIWDDFQSCGVPLFDRGRWRRVSEPREAARNRRLRAVHGSPAEQATIDRGRAEDRRVPKPDRVLAPHRVKTQHDRVSAPYATRGPDP